MFVDFIYTLRGQGVPVGTHETVALARALSSGLHDSSLDGFYHVARALLIHSERHLDAFDRCFAHVFRGAEGAGLELHRQLLDWLKDARAKRDLSPEEAALLEAIDPEELERMFQERLREQKERHDGGNHWIGTGGTSPFGHSGHARQGIRVGGPGGNRSAIRVAEARGFAGYRDDQVLDTRQLSVALRKLRAFSREGAADELDLEATVDETARNLGELEVVVRPPRRSNTRVILMMDVGGSMDPHALVASRLFSAAKRASHFRELRTYYFHNCVYGRVFEADDLREPVPLSKLFGECDRRYKLVIVGDALMGPWELRYAGGDSGFGDPNAIPGIGWMARLAEHFPSAAWLNPESPRLWNHPTVQDLGSLFPMFPLTLEGLGRAVDHLTGRVRAQTFVG